MKIYIDTEFDAIKDCGRYKQRIISIGALLVSNEFEVCATFYENVRPKGFQKLSKIVSKMTNLTDEQILQAKSFPKVIQDFIQWIQSYTQEKVDMYCFGPDDIRTLVSNCEDEHIENEFFHGLIDIQMILSKYVAYEDEIISSTLSLDDLKAAYAFSGEVEHNALSDAKDLMQLHQAYLQQRPLDEAAIAAIVQRKKQKAEAGRRKWMKQQICRQIIPYIDRKLTLIKINDIFLHTMCSICKFDEQIQTTLYNANDMKCWVQFVKRNGEYYVHIRVKGEIKIDEYIPLSDNSYSLFSYCFEQLSKVIPIENKKITCKFKKM